MIRKIARYVLLYPRCEETPVFFDLTLVSTTEDA